MTRIEPTKLVTLPQAAAPPVLALADSVPAMTQSALRDLLGKACSPEVLSFSVGLPASELFPAEAMSRAFQRVLAEDPGALQYGLPSRELKAQVAGLMRRRGVSCDESQILLTTGAQQGMDLVTRLLLNPGGAVMVEETVYDGIHMVLKPYRPELLAVPTSAAAGIDVEAVAARLAAGARPAFLYLIPEGHNPLGGSLTLEQRLALVELARAYGLPLVEDDAYGHLTYDAEAVPPLRAFDERWVLYLGSYSKILAPGLRIGWLVVPANLVPVLSALKHASDIDTATVAQRALALYLEAEDLASHVARLRRAYRERRDALLAALDRHLGDEARWSRPASGFFVWLELPRDLDAARLLPFAIESERVAFCPGAAFDVAGRRHAGHCLRLSFANLSPERIDDGVARLARAIRRYRARLPSPGPR